MLVCPVERRRPTRPLADEPLSTRAARGGEGWKGGPGGRRPGVGGTRRARARVRACGGRWRPGRPVGCVWGRWSSAVGRRARKGGWAERGRVWQGGSTPPSPRPPVCPPHAPRPRGDTVTPRRLWPPDADARPRAAAPRTRERRGVLSRRVSLSPARPTSPPRRPSEVWARGLRGVGVPSPPPRAPPSPAPFTRPRSRPPAPTRGASGASRDGWRGGGGGDGSLWGRSPARPSVPFPPPALDRFPAGRRPSAPGPPPPRRAPSTAYLSPRAPGSSPPPPPSSSSVGRPSGSLWLPLCRPPPACVPLPARHPVPVEASLPPSVARRGPGTRVRGKGPRGPLGCVGCSGAERRGPRPGASVVVWGERR